MTFPADRMVRILFVMSGSLMMVLIPFEICDYALTQYVIDAAAQGRNKVLLEIGHFNCEELGMKATAR